jgi:hypothetical protein
LPLKKVEINGVLNGGISTVTVQQIYKNRELSDIDGFFEFPLIKNSTIISCTATIGDRVI